jgi:hypothetical protein
MHSKGHFKVIDIVIITAQHSGGDASHIIHTSIFQGQQARLVRSSDHGWETHFEK